MMDLSGILQASDLEALASSIPFIRILMTRRTSAFSRDSQFVYIIAFGFKYLHSPVVRPNTSDDLILTYDQQHWIRIAVAVIMWATFLVSISITDYFEAEADRTLIYGGSIASFVLAADFANYDRSRLVSIVCTFGSYLDVLSWVPQFQFTLKKMYIDQWVLLYIIGLFTYEFLNMGNMTPDYYRNFMYGDMKFKISLLKFFLFFGFLLKYFRGHLTIRVESMNEIVCESSVANEVIVVSSAEEYSDKMLFRTLGMEDVLVNRRLMSPY